MCLSWGVLLFYQSISWASARAFQGDISVRDAACDFGFLGLVFGYSELQCALARNRCLGVVALHHGRVPLQVPLGLADYMGAQLVNAPHRRPLCDGIGSDGAFVYYLPSGRICIGAAALESLPEHARAIRSHSLGQ